MEKGRAPGLSAHGEQTQDLRIQLRREIRVRVVRRPGVLCVLCDSACPGGHCACNQVISTFASRLSHCRVICTIWMSDLFRDGGSLMMGVWPSISELPMGKQFQARQSCTLHRIALPSAFYPGLLIHRGMQCRPKSVRHEMALDSIRDCISCLNEVEDGEEVNDSLSVF